MTTWHKQAWLLSSQCFSFLNPIFYLVATTTFYTMYKPFRMFFRKLRDGSKQVQTVKCDTHGWWMHHPAPEAIFLKNYITLPAPTNPYRAPYKNVRIFWALFILASISVSYASPVNFLDLQNIVWWTLDSIWILFYTNAHILIQIRE